MSHKPDPRDNARILAVPHRSASTARFKIYLLVTIQNTVSGSDAAGCLNDILHGKRTPCTHSVICTVLREHVLRGSGSKPCSLLSP